MKTRYQRLDKMEKKEIYNQFKIKKKNIYIKMNRMFIICIIGMIYSIIALVFDIYNSSNIFNISLDIIVFIFCLVAYLKTNKTKIDLLNTFLQNSK